jgi:hypothetical protein
MKMMSISESNGTPEKKTITSEPRSGKSDYSAPVRALRWFVIRFFKIVEGIIRLFGLIYYGVKTVAVLLFRYFIWPYPIYFRRFRMHR